MSAMHSGHQYADATAAQPQNLQSHHITLNIRQQPIAGKLAVGKEKDRKPLDPPPIIQLSISREGDPVQNYPTSPYFFLTCALLTDGDTVDLPAHTRIPIFNPLSGTIVSSLHRLKDDKGIDGAFFVFTDLSVKHEGRFKLQFNLYEMNHRVGEARFLAATISNTFAVQSTKVFVGMEQSTPLTRTFNDQGVRMRVRKHPKDLLRKKGPSSHDYEPQHYKRVQTGASISREPSDMRSVRVGSTSYSQLEAPGSMQAPPLPYEHRPQPHRSFTQGSDFNHSDEHLTKRTRTGPDHSESQSFVQQHYQPHHTTQFDESQQLHRYQHPQQPPYNDYSQMAPPPHQQQQQHMFSGYHFGQNQPSQHHSPTHDFQFESPYRQEPTQNQPGIFFSQGGEPPQFPASMFEQHSPTLLIDPVITQAESRLTDMNLQSLAYPNQGHQGFHVPPMQEQYNSSALPTTTGPMSATEGEHPAHFDHLGHMGPHYQ